MSEKENLPGNHDIDAMPFETALEKLENIVAAMEKGELPLDGMIKNFEAGSALASACRKKLEKLEKRIELLIKEDAKGGEWQIFDDSSERKTAALKGSSAKNNEDEDRLL